MTDLSMTIIPKSDQINADDLISGPRTIAITRVTANPDSSEQPISIYFEGDGGKPYKPCKSMRRVLVHIWGKDGSVYPGRSLTLYRDPKVKFGGLEVGGIRISHMSHMDKDITLALTVTRAAKKAYVVKPLVQVREKQADVIAAPDKHRSATNTMISRVRAAQTQNALFAVTDDAKVKAWRDTLRQQRPELEEEIVAAVSEAYQRLVPRTDDEGADTWAHEEIPA